MIDYAFIDSGTGGIPYLIHLLKKNPNANCAYIGDNANFPYGQKSHEQIEQAVLSLCERIVTKLNPKVIVIACNTISVNTLDICRKTFPQLQFVGTVPAIKTAGEISKKRRIGLLATASTVNHPYNQDLKRQFANDCELILRADPELISFIEHKSFTATKEERESACLPAVNFFKQNDCDVIILGCTHFLNLSTEMQTVAGNQIKIVDSKEGVVNHALEILSEKTPSNLQNNLPFIYTTAQTDRKEYDVICKEFNLKYGGIL